jgi:hypothetical protein
VRSLYSGTHQSEQNVKRRAGTSRLHQRHSALPLLPFGKAVRSAAPPGMVREVLASVTTYSA